MTARTQLTVLDRLHTLVTLGLGAAVVIAIGLNMPKPSQTPAQFAWVAVGLAAGYGAAFLADVSFAHLVRGRRNRLLAAIRSAEPKA